MFVEEISLLGSVIAARGAGVAQSTERLPRAYAEAAAVTDPSQADEIQFATDAARQMARSMARHGYTGG